MNDCGPCNGSLDFRLLNDYQHDFPLVAAPFARIAEECGGGSEREVIEAYFAFRRDGRIARIGAVFAPRRIGASTLAAMRVPAARLDAVAAIVNRYPEVNHNYEREHEFNLWFVATAGSAGRLAAALASIEASTGLPLLRLPLEEEYHIDLGFALDRVHGRVHGPVQAAVPELAASSGAPKPMAIRLDGSDQALVTALQEGLPLCAHPYAQLAQRLQIPESSVLARITAWKQCGIVKRFGVVVRHRELGYTANAMVVHDVADDAVAAVGHRLGREDDVTLCYRRPRVLPDWRYNLFCMIHGRERAEVEARIDALRRRHGLTGMAHAVLFSRTRYKQQGARYAEVAA